jgi:hypothetical protein
LTAHPAAIAAATATTPRPVRNKLFLLIMTRNPVRAARPEAKNHISNAATPGAQAMQTYNEYASFAPTQAFPAPARLS